MKKNTIRNELIRVLWSGDRHEYAVLVVDRLAPGNVKRIDAGCIRRVDSTYMHVKCRGDAEESVIPLHRILAILRGGVEVWSRYRRG